MLIIFIYDSAPTFGEVVLVPWWCLQLAAVPVVVGVYGIAGLADCPGSNQWWPVTPSKPPRTADDAAAILGGYDITGPAGLRAE